ncbi:MAG: SET domain-containing protein-lysine N-methyltransferase [Burkholderiales bacterium]
MGANSKKKMGMQRGNPRRISVRRSGIHGKGVFAAIFIPRGTRIVEYRGRRMSEAEADRKYDDTDPHTFLFLLDGEIVIDANHEGNSARWINHGCDPNCEPVEEKGRLFIEAIRDIAPGTELTYDYNLIVGERHTPALKRRYACGCGARKCRGTMLGAKR